MRTRSPATSPLRAGVWPDELAAARLAAAEQGLDRLAPNPLPLVPAEARATLASAAKSLQVLLGVQEIVRTCLAADVDAAQLGILDQRDARDRADVHDVEAAACLAR